MWWIELLLERQLIKRLKDHLERRDWPTVDRCFLCQDSRENVHWSLIHHVNDEDLWHLFSPSLECTECFLNASCAQRLLKHCFWFIYLWFECFKSSPLDEKEFNEFEGFMNPRSYAQFPFNKFDSYKLRLRVNESYKLPQKNLLFPKRWIY